MGIFTINVPFPNWFNLMLKFCLKLVWFRIISQIFTSNIALGKRWFGYFRVPPPKWKIGQNLPVATESHIYTMYIWAQCWSGFQWICCIVLEWSGLYCKYRNTVAVFVGGGFKMQKYRNTAVAFAPFWIIEFHLLRYKHPNGNMSETKRDPLLPDTTIVGAN